MTSSNPVSDQSTDKTYNEKESLTVQSTVSETFRTSSNQVITEYGKQNIFATQVRTQLVDDYSSHPVKAEKTNDRWAMIGMIALLGAYSLTGQILPGVF